MAYNTGMAVEKRCSLNSERGQGRQFETGFTLPSRASFDYYHSNKVIFLLENRLYATYICTDWNTRWNICTKFTTFYKN